MISCNNFWGCFDCLSTTKQHDLIREAGAQQEQLRALNLDLGRKNLRSMPLISRKAQKAEQAQNKNSANYSKLRDDPCDCIPRSECEYMSCA